MIDMILGSSKQGEQPLKKKRFFSGVLDRDRFFNQKMQIENPGIPMFREQKQHVSLNHL